MILHRSLPHYPWMVPALARLPGVLPLQGRDFILRDEVFAQQMALRDDLIAQRLDAVHGLLPKAAEAAGELYDLVLDVLRDDPGYVVRQDHVIRPDGVIVPLHKSNLLVTLGRLVQEDLCILQHNGAEHCLTGAILCFPASWTLHEKLGRAMLRIHRPVQGYEGDMAARVQRMLDKVRPDQGLWRMNYLTYAVPDLHHPRLEVAPRDISAAIEKPYLRCERQCLIRLPKSNAVAFTIHSYVMCLADLPIDALETLPHN